MSTYPPCNTCGNTTTDSCGEDCEREHAPIASDPFPPEIWAVCCYGDELDTAFAVRQAAMEHAAEAAETNPDMGPWRVARYVLDKGSSELHGQEKTP